MRGGWEEAGALSILHAQMQKTCVGLTSKTCLIPIKALRMTLGISPCDHPSYKNALRSAVAVEKEVSGAGFSLIDGWV